MSNSFTNLVPDMYKAAEIVGREAVGMIPRVARDASETRAAKDQKVRFPVAPAATARNTTPAPTPPAFVDNTVTNREITMDKNRSVGFHYTGEEEKGLRPTGNYDSIFQQQIAQAMRTLANEIEAALTALYYNSARAWGTAGTTPLASDLQAISEGVKILTDNGAPKDGRHFVMDSNAANNYRQLIQLTNVNQAGTNSTLRMGEFVPVFGVEIAESAQIATHTVGTSTGQDCTAIEPIGETTIAYDGGDGGTILVGDTVSFANDTETRRYVVNTEVTAAAGNIVINENGLRKATAVGEEIALGSTDYVANLLFHYSAFGLAMRPPAKPSGGDLAINEIVVTDPMSGIPFLVSEYKGYHANQFEVAILYGVGKGNPAFSSIIMG